MQGRIQYRARDIVGLQQSDAQLSIYVSAAPEMTVGFQVGHAVAMKGSHRLQRCKLAHHRQEKPQDLVYLICCWCGEQGLHDRCSDSFVDFDFSRGAGVAHL